MPFMTRMPSDLARFGLKVELVPGWATRGSASFAPAAVVDHWTAGPRGTTARPSLKVVVDGRPGIPGPLCNVYLDRRGVCVIVAAGRANHAGAGGFRGLVGNSAAYGIEAESGGDGDWTPEQLDAYPRLNAALLSGLGRDATWLAGHHIWAPDRKVDIRDIFPAVRARTAEILANPQGDDVNEQDKIDIANKVAELIPGRVWDVTEADPDKPGQAVRMGALLVASAHHAYHADTAIAGIVESVVRAVSQLPGVSEDTVRAAAEAGARDGAAAAIGSTPLVITGTASAAHES